MNTVETMNAQEMQVAAESMTVEEMRAEVERMYRMTRQRTRREDQWMNTVMSMVDQADEPYVD